MSKPKTKALSFAELLDEMRQYDIKRRLKAAFKRNKRPARVKPVDELKDQP